MEASVLSAAIVVEEMVVAVTITEFTTTVVVEEMSVVVTRV